MDYHKISNLIPRMWSGNEATLHYGDKIFFSCFPLECGTWRMSSCAQAMPSECSRRKSFRGSIRRLMTMELMKRELEQLSRHVTDIICTAKSVKRYVVPEGEEGRRTLEARFTLVTFPYSVPSGNGTKLT